MYQAYSSKLTKYILSLALSLDTLNFLAGTSAVLDFTALQETFVDTETDFSQSRIVMTKLEYTAI